MPVEKPMIIICPHNLVDNWKAEVNKWIKRSDGGDLLLQVLVYAGPKRNELFSEDGEYHRSPYPKSKRIIIADSNVSQLS